MQEYINLISNVGFPIAITFFVLIRLEKVVAENTKATKELILYLKTKN